MIYIDPDTTVNQTLKFNSSLDAGLEIDWYITKEGDDTPLYTFSRSLVDQSYYQELTVNLTTDAITLENNTDYVLKGYKNTSLVFKGKLYSTNQTLSEHTLNTYTQRVDNNTYTIYD